jgi:hypothetical protein
MSSSIGSVPAVALEIEVIALPGLVRDANAGGPLGKPGRLGPKEQQVAPK